MYTCTLTHINACQVDLEIDYQQDICVWPSVYYHSCELPSLIHNGAGLEHWNLLHL